MKTFKHSGDLGDIIYSLPTVRAMGGGILFLDPYGGEKEPLVGWGRRTRTKLDSYTIASILPLLNAQPYINGVTLWKGEEVDVNLDRFRMCCDGWPDKNLADAHLVAFGLPRSERDKAWLTVEPNRVARLVISRSLRYHGNYGFWDELSDDWLKDALFVGLPGELNYFNEVFSRAVGTLPTPTILDAAAIIAGSDHFICNQNLCRAIGEGLKVNITVEEYRVAPNTRFERPNARYV